VEQWTPSSIGSVAMGHEISTTSLQLALAGAAVANGGLLVKPRLVIARQRPGQPSETFAPERPERIMRPETAIQMRQMMEGVVLHGTGKKAALAGYTSGGKTGSAQVYDLRAHVYTHTYNASFLGFAPVVNPQIVVAVTLNGTTHGTAGFGGAVAAPVFREVATTALRIFDVPKDLPDSSALLAESRAPKTSSNDDRDAAVGNDLAIAGLGEAPEVWESTGPTQDSAHGVAPTSGASVRTRAVSSVTQPPVHVDAKVEAKVSAEASDADRRPFLTASAELRSGQAQAAPAPWGTRQGGTHQAPGPLFGGTKVPDFRGLPLSSVLAEAAAEGLQVEVHGSGLARDQEPLPGSYLPARAAIRVQFAK
jgi:cell division protein FtsI (penicillin-binding protein 3)